MDALVIERKKLSLITTSAVRYSLRIVKDAKKTNKYKAFFTFIDLLHINV